MIAGRIHHFGANQDDLITLHSGDAGTHLKVWQIANAGPTHVALILTLPGGEGGFPDLRKGIATYALHDDATLRLDVHATSDTPTLFDAVNHSYWNLDGTND